jgi:hypothetical protein
LRKVTRFDCEKKLNEWKNAVEDEYPHVAVHASMEDNGSIHNTIQKKAKEICADLIVIGQSSTHYWLPSLKTVLPMRLAQLTQIPVLTVKPGALHKKSKTIIVPIADEMPDV